MAKLTSQRQAGRFYAQKRRDAKGEYMAANGGKAAGWKSSDAYKRIRKNEQATRSKIRSERFKEKLEKDLKLPPPPTPPPTGQGLDDDNQGTGFSMPPSDGLYFVDVVLEEEPFYQALNYVGAASGSLFDAFNDLRNTGLPTIAQVTDPNGSTTAYKTPYGFALGLQALYKECGRIQSAEKLSSDRPVVFATEYERITGGVVTEKILVVIAQR